MAISRQKKSEIVSRVKGAVSDSRSIVFVNFSGVSVAEVGDMRKDLRGENIKYEVLKKTLLKLALGAKDISGTEPDLKGEIAIAYLTDNREDADITAPARKIFQFQKKYDGKIKIAGGVFDGKFMSLEEMTGIATIPSLNTLRGMFVNVINSPIQRFAIALSKIAETKVTN